MRRRLSFLAAGAAAITPIVFAPAAQARPLASTTEVASAMAAASTISFNCSIPRIGSNQCGNTVTLGPKQTLSVTLVSSGGKAVTFIATDATTGEEYAHTAWLTPGSNKTKIWSAGNRSKSIRVLADAEGWTTVTAKGSYSVA